MGPYPDVTIIGGGIVGASCAYHLAGLRAGKVCLIEREQFLGTGSTGRCAGGFRHQFSTEINIRLSIESVRMILSFSEETGMPADVHQDGYLFLLRKPGEVETARTNVALQNSLGVPSVFLPPEEIARVAPHVCTDEVLGGTFCALDGIGDPGGMTQGYADATRRLGAEIRTGAAATGIRTRKGKVDGVECTTGFIPCGAVVDAAGPYAREVAAWAGLELPVFPERRHVYSTTPFAGAPPSHLMVIDFTTTFYFHRESGGVLMGMGNPGERRGFDLGVDPDFLPKVLEIGLRCFPALGNASIRRAWAGLYEMSPDAHPILGRAPGVNGLYLANGFSGHGFQHAPIAGRLVAEEIVFGAARTVDISALRLDRFSRGQAFPELNVV